MEKVKIALIGAGERGMYEFAPYAKRNPHEIEFVAVAEPVDERRNLFMQQYNIDEKYCFKGWKELLEQPKLADAVLICTQDNMHFEPTCTALNRGYHVLLEKPMSVFEHECIEMANCSDRNNKLLVICHVLRYTKFFSNIKRLLDEGAIGKLISIMHNENVGYWHQAHSFVRGNWRKSKESSPMILAKSCHDMDIMLWLAGAECKKISSFGDLTYFKRENAPQGAPLRCIDGCPLEEQCPYSAMKIYLNTDTDWPNNVISSDLSMNGRVKALKEGPYGRCVFHCDNDVVDHQIVNIEFKNGVTAAFTMCAFTNEVGRSLKLMGTLGEIRADMGKSEIQLLTFGDNIEKTIKIDIQGTLNGHGGGDAALLKDFLMQVREDRKAESLSSAKTSVQSHIMSFAAEKSRLENRVIVFE